MLRLRRVHIHKYRGVLPGEALRFGPEAVFVLGRNGAGKTTFLELLTRLVACDVSHFVKEGGAVDLEWEMVEDLAGTEFEGEHTLWLRYVQEPGEAPEPVVVGGVSRSPPSIPPPKWRLEGFLTPSHSALQPGVNVAAQPVFIPSPSGEPHPPLKFTLSSDHTFLFVNPADGAEVLLELSESANIADSSLYYVSLSFSGYEVLPGSAMTESGWFSLLILFSRVFRFSPVARFDEALETFRSIVGGPGPHLTLPLAEARGSGELNSSRFIPYELLPPKFHLKPTPLENQTYRPDSLPTGSRFLAPLFEAFGAIDIELRPRLVEEDEHGQGLWRTFDIFVRWPGGLKQRHDHLSFGQKRMLAFLWYQAVYDREPVFTDELTNGLHSAWARQISDLLAGRQAFHAVQNPLMLDMAGLGAEEEIASQFVLCETEVSPTGRRWRWRNPTAKEAHELRVAWDAGFENLSEILINRGLW